jgi:restriction endonuclease S subunit
MIINLRNYIFQYLKQDKISKDYLKITTGQAYPQISLEQVRNTQIVLPPLPEQRAIAHVLSLMDSAINKNNQLNISQLPIQYRVFPVFSQVRLPLFPA